MKPLRDYPIQVKIFLPSVILGLGLVALFIFSVLSLTHLLSTLDTTSTEILERIALIDKMVIQSEQIQSDVFQISVLVSMGLTADATSPIQSRLETRLSDLNVNYGQIVSKWDLDSVEKDLLEQMKAPKEAFREQALQAAEVVVRDPALGVVLVRSSTVSFKALQNTLAELHDYEETRIAQEYKNGRTLAQRVSLTAALTSLGIVLTAILTTIFISNKQISRPVQALTDAMSSLAEGDITTEIVEQDRKDEIGDMSRALDYFRQTIIAKSQADSELIESQRALAALMDNLPGFTFRCQNDRDWTMTFISDGCLEMTGYAPKALIGNKTRSYAQIIHPEDQGRVWETIQQALEGKSSFQLEYRILAANGDEQWVWEQGSGVFGEDGKLRFLEGYITDISAQKQVQILQQDAYEQILARQAAVLNLTEDLRHENLERQQAEIEREKLVVLLEAKNRELESFVYTVSHDLKAPLVTLDGFSAALLKEENLSVRGQHYLERIRVNTLHMSKLITELLELSRIGRVVGEKQLIDIQTILNEIYPDFSMDLPGSIMELMEPLPVIHADHVRIRQVFANLIDNAIKFKSPDRPLKIQVGGKIDAKTITIWVADNGIGISATHLQRVFEPFHQLNPGSQGVGMGLTLIKKIIESHGGWIWAESQPGKGTTFYFSMPALEESPKPKREKGT